MHSGLSLPPVLPLLALLLPLALPPRLAQAVPIRELRPPGLSAAMPLDDVPPGVAPAAAATPSPVPWPASLPPEPLAVVMPGSSGLVLPPGLVRNGNLPDEHAAFFRKPGDGKSGWGPQAPPAPAAVVPEPASLVLLGSGLAALLGYRWKQAPGTRAEPGLGPTES